MERGYYSAPFSPIQQASSEWVNTHSSNMPWYYQGLWQIDMVLYRTAIKLTYLQNEICLLHGMKRDKNKYKNNKHYDYELKLFSSWVINKVQQIKYHIMYTGNHMISMCVAVRRTYWFRDLIAISPQFFYLIGKTEVFRFNLSSVCHCLDSIILGIWI